MTPADDPPSDPVLDEIRSFVVATFARGRGQGIDAATPLISSGIVGPGGVGQLARFLEARFHIELDTRDLADRNFNSLAAMAALVANKRR